jgi:glycosyltransferase involved in cell wall biosynthesis
VKDPVTSSPSSAPEISVVVPVRDEENSVRTLLEGLLNQSLPPSEIVITDGGSTDATAEIIQEFIERGAPVKLIRERASLPGRSRNIAVRHSRCEWIAFIDAGIQPATSWLASLAETLGDGSTVDVVYGSYEPVIDSFFKECAAIAYVPPPYQSDGGFVRPRSIVSALMRRKVWEDVGGFPEYLRSAEDLLFMRRVEQAKFRIARTSGAIVYWNIQPDFGRTFKRFVVYSRNNIRAGLFAEWQGAIFIYYALLAVLTLTVVYLGSRAFFIPPALWLLLLTARAAKALRRNRKSYPARLTRNLLRLTLLVPIIATLDAAAFAGSISWLFRDKFRLTGSRGEDDSGK